MLVSIKHIKNENYDVVRTNSLEFQMWKFMITFYKRFTWVTFEEAILTMAQVV